jgi:regulator of protease activity HflC (stomatin/prohibitin superfamily)
VEPISVISSLALPAGVIAGTLLFGGSAFKIIDEEHRGLYERFGEYKSFRGPGFHLKIPVIDTIRRVKVAEQSANISPSDMITQDNLNAEVDLVVYYQVRDTEKDVKSAAYTADDYERQIISLARTTARNVIGEMSFEEVNSKRAKLNNKLQNELDDETDKWGIDVVRVEMEEISPPEDVQDSMNEILKAENEKDAAQDRAEAKKIEASGEKEAAIQEAMGKKKAQVLEAQGKAESIETVADAEAKEIKVRNLALQEYFEGAAKTYKELQTVENSLRNGSKYVIDSDSDVRPIISEVGGVSPIDDSDLTEEQQDFLQSRFDRDRDLDIDTEIDIDEEKIKKQAKQEVRDDSEN